MPDDSKVSRRELIVYGSAVGTTAFAGCLGDDGGNGSGNGDDTGGGNGDDGDDTGGGNGDDGTETEQRLDATYRSYMTNNPEEHTNWNRWDPTAILNWPVRELITSRLAHKDTGKQEYIPYLAESWDESPDRITANLREGQEWHDGEAFTADDVVTYWELTRHTAGLPGALSEVNAADDLTVEFVFENDVNPMIAKDTAFLDVMHTSEHVFGEYVERFEDASNEDEEEDVHADLQDLTLEDPYSMSNGLWRLENKTASRFQFEVHEPHFAASEINFSNWETVLLEEGQRTQAIRQGELDLAPGDVTQEVLDSLPDHVEPVDTNAYGGGGALFNSEVDHLDDYRVTQALTHAIEAERVAELQGPGQTSIDEVRNTGIIPPEFNNMFSDDEVDKLTDYTGRNTDVAADLLEEAEFEQSGDEWLKPDGDVFEVKIIAWAAEDVARVIGDHLGDFGIETEVLVQDAGAIWGNYLQGSEPWDIAAWGWGAPNIQGAAIWSYERSFGKDGVFRTNTGTPEEIEVPWPAFDPDGVSTVNTAEMVDEYQSTTDEDEAMEILKGLSWAYNQYIPNMQLSLGRGTRLMSYDGWDMPDPDDPIMGMPWPPWTLMNTGRLKAEE